MVVWLEKIWDGDREWKYCGTSLEKRGKWVEGQDEELGNICNVLRSSLGSAVEE